MPSTVKTCTIVKLLSVLQITSSAQSTVIEPQFGLRVIYGKPVVPHSTGTSGSSTGGTSDSASVSVD